MRSNSWPKLSAFLCDGARNSGSLHLTLGVDDDASVVFEVEEVTLSSSVGLSLSDDHSRHDLLSKFGLSLLAGGQEQLANGSLRESGESGTDLGDGDNVQVLGSGVVGAVHDTGGGETGRDSEFDSASSSSCSLAHF